MREIKFRGQTTIGVFELDIKEGYWVYGDLITNNGKPFIVNGVVEANSEYIAIERWVSVDPKTIGQYTGLKDKNGVEIYEGDIIEYMDAYSCSTEAGYDWNEYMNKGVMTWSESEACFFVTNMEGIDHETLISEIGDSKVVGNIHDNPELIK